MKVGKAFGMIFFTLITFCANSIEKKDFSSDNEKMGKSPFGKSDKDFKVTEFPEKWKEESAIILCQKYKFEYYREKKGKLLIKKKFRKRVKINDKSAVNDFSVFYFVHVENVELKRRKEEYKYSIKLIKTNGKKKNINLDDAVEVAVNEVPDNFKWNSSAVYKKIAIPNLEEGDIIDYSYKDQTSKHTSKYEFFSPFVTSLTSTYPILKQEYKIMAGEGFKVSFRTFNEAGKTVEKKMTSDKYGKGVKISLTDNERDSYKSEFWKFPYLKEPTIKFQVFYLPRKYRSSVAQFFDEKGVLDEEIDLKKIQTRVSQQKSILNYKYHVKYAKKRVEEGDSNLEIAKKIYYKMRYKYCERKLLWFNYPFTNREDYKEGKEIAIDYDDFTNTFIKILNEVNIPCQYVIANDRQYGTLKEVLFSSELYTAVKVEDQYFFPFTNFTGHDFVPAELLGSEAIIFKANLSKTEIKESKRIKKAAKNYNLSKSKYLSIPFEKINIAIDVPKKNSIHNYFNIAILDDYQNIQVNSKCEYLGYMKKINSNILLFGEDYLEEDKEMYRIQNETRNKPSTARRKGNVNRIAESDRIAKAQKDDFTERKIELMKEYRNEEYDVEDYISFEIESRGRNDDNPKLIFNEQFTLNNIIHKAGENYIVNLGEMIGKQLELEEDDMTRESSININYPKSYNYHINFKIPEGYKVQGLDQLNVNISSNVGEFISTAKVENGQIKLDVTKKYKVIHAEKEEWPKFVEFLEGAYNFTQKKVVLKK